MVEVRPSGEALGAEIVVDLAGEIDEATFRAVEAAFHEHIVVVFRGQRLSSERQIAFSRRFGELEVHIVRKYLLAGYPEILLVSNVRDAAGEHIGLADAGFTWHSDVSYRQRPSRCSLLYAVEVPEEGGRTLGDTVFANTVRAYEALPSDMKSWLVGRKAVHRYSERMRVAGSPRPKLTAAQLAETTDVAHPIVRTHPVTGRKALYVTMGIAALWQEVTKIAEPPPLPFPPDPTRQKVPPSPVALAAAKRGRRLAIAAYASVAASILIPMLITPPATFWLIAGIVGIMTAIIMTIGNASPDKERLKKVKGDWNLLRSSWQTQPSHFARIRRDLDAVKARHDALPAVRAQRLQQLSDQKHRKQLQDHLDQFSINSAKISGIGPVKVAMLGSYGIDTAGDIVAAKIMAVPGFGAATTQKLVAWRQRVQTSFRFDPNRAISPSDIAAVQRDIDVQSNKIQQELANGLANLKAITAAAVAHRQALEDKAAELLPRYAQAASDAAVTPGNPNTYKSLMALASVAVGVTLLSLIPNSAPLAGSTEVQVAVPQVPSKIVALPPPPLRSATSIPLPLSVPTKQADIVAPTLPPLVPPSVPREAFPAPATNGPSQQVQTRQAVNMRSAPDSTSAVIRIVPKGTVMTIFARRDGWMQVGEETPLGWIYSGLLGDAP